MRPPVKRFSFSESKIIFLLVAKDFRFYHLLYMILIYVENPEKSVHYDLQAFRRHRF